MWLVLMCFSEFVYNVHFDSYLCFPKQPEFQTFLVPLALFSPVHAYVSLLLRSAPWGQRSLAWWKTGRDLIRQKTQEKDTSKAWKLFKVKGTHAASFVLSFSKVSSWSKWLLIGILHLEQLGAQRAGLLLRRPRARRGFPHTSVSILPDLWNTHQKKLPGWKG